MNKKHIFVIEDEEANQILIKSCLIPENYKLTIFSNSESAIANLYKMKPDLILLDINLPGKNGLESLGIIRNKKGFEKIPIIMLTAKSSDIDQVLGLELGADDYITKPFTPQVLLARLKVTFRRFIDSSLQKNESIIDIHGLVIDSISHQVQYKSQQLNLTITEFKILLSLAKKPGWVLSREQLIQTAHGDFCDITNRAIDVQIVTLRKKLGEASPLIETVRGVGYRFKKDPI
ncbi:MAG: DNA-binding response regulator [Candidatus Cloacimonadota bacterium]|nr:MAG: DNA-binding response regulator [Candidatus Cloacimonadota bacterium]